MMMTMAMAVMMMASYYQSSAWNLIPGSSTDGANQVSIAHARSNALEMEGV
jgi:hypothetical protein